MDGTDLPMTEPSTTTTATAKAAAAAAKPHSYLLSYLQKSDLFTPKLLTKEDFLNLNLTSSLQSSITSDQHDPDYQTSRSARNSLTLEPPTAAPGYYDGDDEEEPEDIDELSSDYESEPDPDELTNLPYKSPAVYGLPGSGNGNRFRTLVRDGPLGSVQGESQRFVVIGRRSFRGAGLWPEQLVEVDLEMGGVALEKEDSEESEEDEEDVGLEGEVEVMWSDGGEEFWLVRDPAEDGGIGRETSWVSKEWFMLRKGRKGRPQPREQVDLRLGMGH